MQNFYGLHNNTTESKKISRKRLYELFKNRPLNDEHLLTNMGLYVRSSALAKVFFLNELYEEIKNIPGSILNFGIWWGQDMALFENLRAIHEPYNHTRKIIGFDTFEGYPELSNKDVASEVIKVGGYSTSEGYDSYLKELLFYHEEENGLCNRPRCVVAKGNIMDTLEDYFHKNPETIVALANIDLALYEPCSKVLSMILPHLVKGSVICFDELNDSRYPGETIAFKEFFLNKNYTIHRSKFLPDRSYVVMR
jgi:hypothetical protein